MVIMGKWMKVFNTENPIRAEIVKDLLEEKGLSPVIINKKESATQIGFCEVLVIQDEVLSAKKIVENDISFE